MIGHHVHARHPMALDGGQEPFRIPLVHEHQEVALGHGRPHVEGQRAA